MHRVNPFIVTAFLEVGIGVLLLVIPDVPLDLLLGLGTPAPELLVARLAGASLLALGAASWWARKEEQSEARLGLRIGLVFYDGAAAALLAYAGLGMGIGGMALWPAVVTHAVLAFWLLANVRCKTSHSGDLDGKSEIVRGDGS